MKEHEQVGDAICVDVGERTNDLPCRRVKILNEIDLVVEVAIGLATNENAVLVELFDVRSAVEVRVDSNAGDAAVSAICAPHIRPSITIEIFSSSRTTRKP